MTTTDRLKALLSAATPGPVDAEQHMRGDGAPLEGGDIYAGDDGDVLVAECARYKDACLFAELRNAAPALLAVVEAARDMRRAQMVHAFTPRGNDTEEDRDTCAVCGKNFRDADHLKVNEGHPFDIQRKALAATQAALAALDEVTK